MNLDPELKELLTNPEFERYISVDGIDTDESVVHFTQLDGDYIVLEYGDGSKILTHPSKLTMRILPKRSE